LIFKRIGWAAALTVAITVGAAAMDTPVAAAQTDCGGSPCNQVEATPKGTIGLGLLGAEIGLMIPALAGLHKTWAFIVFPLIGAAGGAVGGYFAFDNADREELAIGALVLGMAMIVPTLVITLKLTAYDPEDEAAVEATPDDPASEDSEFEEAPAEEEARLEQRDRALAGAGLLHLSPRGLVLGMPALSVRQAFTQDEQRRFGVGQRAEMHMPLLTGTF